MLVELSVIEQRFAAVMEVVRDGLSVAEVAERAGVSRQSIYTWVANYEAGGLAGLADKSHRPASCPHQVDPKIEAEICEMRRTHPTWGQRRIHHELARAGGLVPSESTIFRALVRNGLLIPGRGGARSPTINVGNGPGRWSCGRWMSWAAFVSPMAAKPKCSPAWTITPGSASPQASCAPPTPGQWPACSPTRCADGVCPTRS